MRLLVILLTIVLFVSILGFVLTNLETRVGVTIWKIVHPDVPLFGIVILSVLAGIVYAGILAVAEGAHLRLANRRLRRDVEKLETEVNYLRTQSSARQRVEPDALLETASPAEGPEPAGREAGTAPASAPVYGTDDEWEPESGEGEYSGGRAV